MNIEFPKSEYILYNRKEKLSQEQQHILSLLVLHQGIMNNAIKDYVGLNKDNCKEMYLSSFLTSLYDGICKNFSGKCKEKLMCDDFIYISDIAEKPLKYIINNPSTRLIKVEEQIRYNKVKNTGIKTMQWLARRPGVTIMEKISPKNKVMTQSTRFTVDTKENEASMYLYDIIYRALSDRLFRSECADCKEKNCETKKLYDRLSGLYSLRTSIRKSDLNDIPKSKPSVKNNKLMCDKNYKVIWDCINELTNMERNLNLTWDNIYLILCKDLFYCLLSIVYNMPKTIIKDVVGKIVVKENGIIDFENAEEITFLHADKDIKEYIFSLDNDKIHIKTKELKPSRLHLYDVSQIHSATIKLAKFIKDLQVDCNSSK